MTTDTLTLPDLSEESWRLVLNACVGAVDIPAPADPQTSTTVRAPQGACPARAKLASRIAADLALDELPADHPSITETLQPFPNLSEADAATVLLVNNRYWLATRDADA